MEEQRSFASRRKAIRIVVIGITLIGVFYVDDEVSTWYHRTPSWWNHRYSGKFQVANRSNVSLTEVKYSNFGYAGPLNSQLIPGGGGTAVFPAQSTMPIRTMISWYEADQIEDFGLTRRGEQHQQVLSLEGIAPRGCPGLWHFISTPELKWTVTFQPEKK